MDKTLREVCETFKVSRRAVQGYEKAGLVSASGHNQRGYLLYDMESQKRIELIKMYQNLGFTIKEIQQIIDAEKQEIKYVLVHKLSDLQEQKKYLEQLINQVQGLIQQL